MAADGEKQMAVDNHMTMPATTAEAYILHRLAGMSQVLCFVRPARLVQRNESG
jgi:hypothetical protein